MKDTKKSWTWKGRDKDPRYDGLDGFALVSSDGDIILQAAESWASQMPNRAEQMLIASAPKLKEALKLCLSTYGRTCEQEWDGVPLDEWEASARAAIAEAEGKECQK